MNRPQVGLVLGRDRATEGCWLGLAFAWGACTRLDRPCTWERGPCQALQEVVLGLSCSLDGPRQWAKEMGEIGLKWTLGLGPNQVGLGPSEIMMINKIK